MNIIFNSYTGIGAWFMLRLLEEGHSVHYNFTGKRGEGDSCLAGLVPSPTYSNSPKFENYELSIFDLTGRAELAEKSAVHTPTIGDSELASELEEDRLFGIEAMEASGIKVPPYEVFGSVEEARSFVSKTKKRYVFKPNGGQDQESASTYVSTSYEDLLEYLDKLEEDTKGAEFLLQEFVGNGVEVSTEAYFNGDDFYFVNATLEEKKFMNGNIGPATGCVGNLVWAYAEKPKVFKQGLEKLGGFLYDHNYRGMVDLNTIVTDGEVYGLEWTPRFGYDASATLFALIQQDAFGEFLYSVAAGERPDESCMYTGLFSASVRVSVPPYPYEEHGIQKKGIPLGGIEPEDVVTKMWLWDAMLEEGNLITCGEGYGVVGAPIGIADTPSEAFDTVNKRIKSLKIPNLQYRTDLLKYTYDRYTKLDRMGWLRP